MPIKNNKIFGKELGAILGVANRAADNDHIEDSQNALELNTLEQLDVSLLQSGRFQPRENFDQTAINELANSIKAQGILQPLVVKKVGDKYEIVIGERRWRAAKIAGLNHVPAFICNISNETALAYGLIENIQRKELNSIEEAKAINRLINEFSLTHEQVASAIGRSRASITNLVRLLALPDKIQQMVVTGNIEMGHARALLPLKYEEQIKLANDIIGKKLSVRGTEGKVRAIILNKHSVEDKLTYEDQIKNFQERLSKKLNLNVEVKINNKGQGRATVFFDSPDKLELIINKISS